MLPFELLLVVGLVSASAQPLSNSHDQLELLESSSAAAATWDAAQLTFSDDHARLDEFNQYQCFGGHIEQYPAINDWLSWKALWSINRERVLSANGGDTYLQHYVEEATQQVASESQVDPRLILAIIMQETNGQAGAACKGPVPRCGIMSAGKTFTFDSSKPRKSVLQAIREGVEGSQKSGPGLAKLLSGKPVLANLPKGNPYAAVRAYNSYSVSANLDAASQGQPRYVNDIANRLLGWDGRGRAFKDCQ